MVSKRDLTEEEKLLWKQVTQGDARLESKKKTQITIKKPKKESPKNIQKPELPLRELKQGDYAGIDKNTAKKFRTGKDKIDARLDLHGMTLERAHKSLLAFIAKQIKLENRRLLVITGKGSGALRSSLPNWLDTPALSKHILAFDKAQPKDGGDGAYYVLLRRTSGG